ncbi:hypothetical protein [Roseibium sp. MMSF_3412]|uniref:hypothetical protein n=1 Tax=Roseibium sp. MMSF_3412 TaxID=3046712 RepID=UPI00273FF763|nr:hypothetical protein [Roseibium sp. MMSF_3412]
MFRRMIGAALVAVVLGGPAHALTIGYTEGSRDLVDGTQKLGDASSSSLGTSLGVLGFGASDYRQIDLHGRIVGATDFFSFSATSNFIVEFIFGPISVKNGTKTVDGGFVQEGKTGNKSEFVLDLMNGSDSKVFQTNILSEADNMGTSLIFKAMAGTPYTFSVQNGPGNNPSGAATYDIRLTAVPIPAALPLLAGGLGLLGFVGWRRKRSA